MVTIELENGSPLVDCLGGIFSKQLVAQLGLPEHALPQRKRAQVERHAITCRHCNKERLSCNAPTETEATKIDKPAYKKAANPQERTNILKWQETLEFE